MLACPCFSPCYIHTWSYSEMDWLDRVKADVVWSDIKLLFVTHTLRTFQTNQSKTQIELELNSPWCSHPNRWKHLDSTVQYSTVQYITVQYSTVQYITVQYITVQYIILQYKFNPTSWGGTPSVMVLRSTLWYDSIQGNTKNIPATSQLLTIRYLMLDLTWPLGSPGQ